MYRCCSKAASSRATVEEDPDRAPAFSALLGNRGGAVAVAWFAAAAVTGDTEDRALDAAATETYCCFSIKVVWISSSSDFFRNRLQSLQTEQAYSMLMLLLLLLLLWWWWQKSLGSLMHEIKRSHCANSISRINVSQRQGS